MTTLQGQVAAEQVQQWKDKHGKVFTYVVDGKIAYLKSVSRDDYAKASTKLSVAPAKFTESLINSCWLGGDEDIREKEEYYFGLADHMERLLNKKAGELGEL